MINVLIVDDHKLIRVGLKNLMSAYNDVINVVDAVGSGEECLRYVKQNEPDVILMDMKMPGIGGFEAARRLHHTHENIKTLALSAYDDEILAARFIQMGGHGFINKDSSMDELVAAIRKVYAGGQYIKSDIAQKIIEKKHSTCNIEQFQLLSQREWQILMMIAEGGTVLQIANRLCLSPKTIHSYRYRLHEKLNVLTDVELAHIAFQNGIYDMKCAVGQE